MPKLKNKLTGAVYVVTPKELERFRLNKSFIKSFEVTDTVVPEEVVALQERNKRSHKKKNSK